jgi:REP element-mobilizing transposase RayT
LFAENHFHFLVRIKSQTEQRQSEPIQNHPGKQSELSQQFSNLLNAYAKAMNKVYQRTGSLFQSRFGRKLVTTDAHFYAIVAYIHCNPQRHKFVSDFREWPYSSYHALISDQPTWLKRDDVLSWYGSRDEFVAAHLKKSDWVAIQYLLDDD